MNAPPLQLLGRMFRFWLALCLAIAPLTVQAAPSKKVDRQVKKLSRRAEKMLDALEFERARALLEATVRNPKLGRARPRTRARVWALLGRARAELGDQIGSDEAFLEAVRWSRKVRLSRSTSPKIRDALERARRLAPPPGASAQAEVEPPPPRRAPKPPTPVEAPRPTPKAPRAKAPPPRRPRSKPSRTRRTRRTPRKRRWIDFRVQGGAQQGTRVKLIASFGGIPETATLEAHVRRGATGPFEKRRLTRTGTVATADLVLDAPRLDVFVLAKRKRRVLARAGSAAKPRKITPTAGPPPMAEAWSGAASRPSASIPPLPEGAATTTSSAAPPPPPLTPPPAPAPSARALDTTEVALLAVGGAIVVAGVVTAVLIFATRTPNCNVREGQGCVEVEIAPSALVRF